MSTLFIKNNTYSPFWNVQPMQHFIQLNQKLGTKLLITSPTVGMPCMWKTYHGKSSGRLPLVFHYIDDLLTKPQKRKESEGDGRQYSSLYASHNRNGHRDMDPRWFWNKPVKIQQVTDLWRIFLRGSKMYAQIFCCDVWVGKHHFSVGIP